MDSSDIALKSCVKGNLTGNLSKSDISELTTMIIIRVGEIQIVIIINCNLITFSKAIASNCIKTFL